MRELAVALVTVVASVMSLVVVGIILGLFVRTMVDISAVLVVVAP